MIARKRMSVRETCEINVKVSLTAFSLSRAVSRHLGAPSKMDMEPPPKNPKASPSDPGHCPKPIRKL